MADIPFKADCQKLIDEANRHDITSGENPTRPATDEEIASLRQRAAQRGLGVDEDFVTFLRYANGIDYSCLTIPCAKLPPRQPFVDYNDDLSFFERPVYGNLNDTYYVLSLDGKFQRVSASNDVISTHGTFFEMVSDGLAMVVFRKLDSGRIAELDLHLDEIFAA